VQPLQSLVPGVLAEIIRLQPASKERTAFAWTVAVGPAIARATTVQLDGTLLVVRARGPQWAREVDRARSTVIARLQHLLGSGVVEDLRILPE
jgi:hypothetical protein